MNNNSYEYVQKYLDTLDNGNFLEICIQLKADASHVNTRFNDGDTPLHRIIRNKSDKQERSLLAELLLEHGAWINARDESEETILHLAVDQGDGDLIKLLAQHGVDLNTSSKYHHTALHTAILHDNPEMIELLYSLGSGKHEDDDPDTLLCLAVRKEHIVSLKKLLDLGLDPNTDTKGRLTPLMFAVEHYLPDTFDLLLEYGANPNLTVTTSNPPANVYDILKEVPDRGAKSKFYEMLKKHGYKKEATT